jgi:hypothetical protein
LPVITKRWGAGGFHSMLARRRQQLIDEIAARSRKP